MSKEFFPKRPEATPTIYAYELPNDSSRKGWHITDEEWGFIDFKNKSSGINY